MNRPIKFRAWTGTTMEYRVVAGELGAFYAEGLDPKDTACISPFNTIYSKQTPIMQFTGLLDKNGKEIYEGDIVRDTRYSKRFGENAGLAKVVFRMENPSKDEMIDDLFGGKTNLNGFISHVSEFGFEHLTKRHLAFHVQSIEVIGNIYENPELLIPQP